jgi:hypothetical protein
MSPTNRTYYPIHVLTGSLADIVYIHMILTVFPRLIVHSPEIFNTKITTTYGLSQRCEQQITRIPGPNGRGKFEYTDFECRNFPAKVADHCEQENEAFCAAWTSARYVVELAIWCSALSLCAIVFGVSTHSRRRRIWRAVAGLVLLHGTCNTYSELNNAY